MSKYSDWLASQDEAFIQELTNGEITDCFIDRNIRPIDLDELERLDNLYVSDVLKTPVGI